MTLLARLPLAPILYSLTALFLGTFAIVSMVAVKVFCSCGCGSAIQLPSGPNVPGPPSVPDPGKVDVERVKAGPSADGWTDRERSLLQVVDELHHDKDVTDATWDALGRHLNDRERIELVLLASHYEMLATTIATLRIQPDARRH